MQLVSKISNLSDPDPPTLQTDRQTDGQTTCNLNTVLCTNGKNNNMNIPDEHDVSGAESEAPDVI